MNYRFSNKGKEYSFDISQLTSDELAKFNKLTPHQKERFITAWNLENESDMKDEISLATVEEPSKTTNFINSVIARYQQKVNDLKDIRKRYNDYKNTGALNDEELRMLLTNSTSITEADLEGFKKTYGTEPTADYLIKYFEKYIEDLNSGTVDTKALYYAEELLKKLNVNYKKFLKDYVIPDVEKNGSSKYLNSNGEVIIDNIPKDTELAKTIEIDHLDEKNKTVEGEMKDLKGAITDLRDKIGKINVIATKLLKGPERPTSSMQSSVGEGEGEGDDKPSDGEVKTEEKKGPIIEEANEIGKTQEDMSKIYKDLRPGNEVYDEITKEFNDNINAAKNAKDAQDYDEIFLKIANMITHNDNPRKKKNTKQFELTQAGPYYNKLSKDRKDNFYNQNDREIKYTKDDFKYDTKNDRGNQYKIVSYPVRKADGVDYVKMALNELYKSHQLSQRFFQNGKFTDDFISYLNDFATNENRTKGRGIKDVFNRLRGKDTKDLTQRLNELGKMINTYNSKAEKQEQRLKEILREIDDIKKHDEQQDTELKKLSEEKKESVPQTISRPSFLNDISKPSQLKPVESNKRPTETIPEWQKILNERRKDIEPDEPEDEESEDWGAGTGVAGETTKRMSLKEYLEMIN